jgi:pimeloyl-ACP methyl ester carboxylesterase
MSELPNVVLVHGAWADGSSWSAVIERLQAEGYNVTAPQFPMNSLADNVARLRLVLSRQNGPTIVAGHSYGGQIMTALGTDAPNVIGLVYIAAFGLDEGESIGALLDQAPPTPALAHLDIDAQGFAWLPEDDFVNHFAADVDPVKARVMYAVQQPLHASALSDVMGVPAWKSLPSWYLGRRRRPGHSARGRAAVRRADGRGHHRGGQQSRGDGLPPRRGARAHHDRRRVARGRELSGWGAVSGTCRRRLRGRARSARRGARRRRERR